MLEACIFFGSNVSTKENKKEVLNPFDNSLASIYQVCSKKDAKEALEIAKGATNLAKNRPLSQKINWLLDVAFKLENEKENIAQTITREIAKPIMHSRVEVDRAIETIRATILSSYLLEGKTINTELSNSGRKGRSFFIREPVGVVVAITPFNFPINLVIHKLAPAILAGNTIILKPSPEAPLCTFLLAKIFIESKFAIKDAISLIYGDSEVGATLVESPIPRVISFTGSVEVGEKIIKSAGIKKVSLELGGNGATFIDRSADLKYTASRCAIGAFINSGQVCISLQRIFIDELIYEDFVNLFVEETKRLKVGSPFEEDTFLSSLINQEAIDRSLLWINEAIKCGAKLIYGGLRDSILHPTIMGDAHEDMKLVCQEVFAPIVTLIKVKDYKEAFSKMNNSQFGLQFSIFTNNLQISQEAISQLNCGGVVINDVPTIRFDHQPYGGIKNSGIGREGPPFAIEEFTEIKNVVIFEK